MDEPSAIRCLAALAHRDRLTILRLLLGAPAGLKAGEISDAIRESPAATSYSLKELQAAGLIKSQKIGRNVYYFAQIVVVHEFLVFLSMALSIRKPGGYPPGPIKVRQKRKKE